jgi:hypothetical protein
MGQGRRLKKRVQRRLKAEFSDLPVNVGSNWVDPPLLRFGLGGSAMTYQDNDCIKNPNDPWQREWGTGSAITSVVAIVIMAGILVYGATRITETGTNSTTILQQPNTTG